MCSSGFFEIFRNTYFVEHLQTTAAGMYIPMLSPFYVDILIRWNLLLKSSFTQVIVTNLNQISPIVVGFIY